MNDLAGRGVAVVGRVWSLVALPIISILLGLLVGAVVILVSQVIQPTKPFDPTLPLTGYIGLFRGAFGTAEGRIDTLVFATPLVLGGLSVALAFKAGLFNIGAHGQFLVGALASVAIGITFNTSPPIVAIPMALGAGMLAGAAWGFIPGVLKAISGAHEVVTTIMLNYIAQTVVAAVVSGPLDQPGSPSPITDDVGTAALPVFIGRSGHLGILVAGLVVLLVAWLLYRTTRGFEIRTVGANPDAARYAGMRPRLILVLTMSLSGLLAGMAGATVVLGVTHQMTASFGSTVGFDSIAVALLGRSNPFGVVLAALLFGAMRAGAPQLQLQAGIPTEIVDVLQATILLFLVASPFLRRALRLRGVKEPVGETDTISKTYGSETIG